MHGSSEHGVSIQTQQTSCRTATHIAHLALTHTRRTMRNSYFVEQSMSTISRRTSRAAGWSAAQLSVCQMIIDVINLSEDAERYSSNAVTGECTHSWLLQTIVYIMGLHVGLFTYINNLQWWPGVYATSAIAAILRVLYCVKLRSSFRPVTWLLIDIKRVQFTVELTCKVWKMPWIRRQYINVALRTGVCDVTWHAWHFVWDSVSLDFDSPCCA